MRVKQKTHSKLMLIGIVLSVAAFFINYFFIEKIVYEYRITYSVPSEDYDAYFRAIEPFSESTRSYTFSISPNFESIADSLQYEGVRRFELKAIYTGAFSVHNIDPVYFKGYLKLNTVEIVRERFVGKSKPFRRSLGISLILICAFVLTNYFVFIKRG